MAERRRRTLPLALVLVPGATLAALLSISATRASLDLQELRLDGLRVTFDSAGGFLEPLPMSEATILADVGQTLGSAIVVLESGERFVIPETGQLTVRRAPEAGPGATLQLSATEISPDSALELQTEDDGTRRLFLPGGDPRALTLGGRWYLDGALVDFGTVGISRIVIDTRNPIQVDFQVEESRDRTLILEDAGIDALSLSRFRPGLSDRAVTTVRSGLVTSDWIDETLDPSSNPSFDTFEGTVDSLWIENGVLRSEMSGREVTGFSLRGRDRMPALLRTLPVGPRRGLLTALLGMVALGVVWLAAPGFRLGSRVRPPGTEESRGTPGTAGASSRRLAAIWFADIVGFTELSARDEDGALEVSEELERLTRQEVDRHGGRIVKLLGDGVLTEFASANAAVRAALALQAGFSASDVVRTNARALRVGVHLCEVVAAPDGDLLGSGVNLASRIESAAEPGSVAVSQDVAHQLRQRKEFRLTPMPPMELKGVEGLAHLFVVEAGDA